MSKEYVLFFGWNVETMTPFLAQNVKLVVFHPDDDNVRAEYEKLYRIYKEKITLYEGDVGANANAFLKLRLDEGISTYKIGMFDTCIFLNSG